MNFKEICRELAFSIHTSDMSDEQVSEVVKNNYREFGELKSSFDEERRRKIIDTTYTLEDFADSIMYAVVEKITKDGL